jgi:hypothetical protein
VKIENGGSKKGKNKCWQLWVTQTRAVMVECGGRKQRGSNNRQITVVCMDNCFETFGCEREQSSESFRRWVGGRSRYLCKVRSCCVHRLVKWSSREILKT